MPGDSGASTILSRVGDALGNERHPGFIALIAGVVSIVGTVLTILALLGTGFLDYGGLKARVEFLDRELAQLAERQDRDLTQLAERLGRIEDQGYGGQINVLNERLTGQITNLTAQMTALQTSMTSIQNDLRSQLNGIEDQIRRVGRIDPSTQR